MNQFRIDYDRRAGAGYIVVTDKPVYETHIYDNGVQVDVDADGQIVGIELIGSLTVKDVTE